MEGPPLRVESIRGSSPAVRELISKVQKVASSTATVLIRGESGTGKSLLAEAIHRNSPRANGPFVKVHCAALSPGLLESELFGHVKGAFTGAHRDKGGRFQRADGGTLFLDEIGDISLDIQTKLLRVLQEMTFEPVGSNESISVDVRVIAATHQPLEELVRKGRLREDLFYRINVISLWMPPLRERSDDILELAMHFLRQFAEQSRKPVTGMDEDVMERLLAHDWPGNIRELENVMERAVVMASGSLITLEDLPTELGDLPLLTRGAPALPRSHDGNGNGLSRSENGRFNLDLAEIERANLLEALAASKGNKTKAARLLGIPRSTLCSKLKRLGID
jgi:DNA-binding NtrC family response regulator